MALRAGQCNQLRSSISRLISVYQQEQHTALSRNSFSLPDLLPSEFCRAFAASPALHSLAEQQFSVLSPTSIAGPITRTPVYAIFELGSKQYKVSAGDVVWVERLKLVDVGTQLALNRVQVLGSLTETLVGRPYVETASVTAVVEEQVQDAKVIAFKKRRRKHSRRIKGHRQLLTGLRITGVNGIMAPEGSKADVVVG